MGKPSVLEIFLHIIQVFKRLINLSTAIQFPNSVRKMRECCPGLTEQISYCVISSDMRVRSKIHLRYIITSSLFGNDVEEMGSCILLGNAETICQYDRICEWTNHLFGYYAMWLVRLLSVRTRGIGQQILYGHQL